MDKEWPVEIIRSERRRKSVSAKLKDGRIIIRAPQAISDEELEPIIANLKAKLLRKAQITPQTNQQLAARAQEMNRDYFDGKLRWHSIKYVTNQNTLYGSCTPSTGKIRLNDRLATMPEFVRDYVIMHEICHLVEANHSDRFWALVNRYPLTERARGYLMALSLEQIE